MADQIDFKSYSDDKLKKAFDYYKKEYKYAEKRGGRQPLIDRYNDIKNEMINRGFIKGNIDTKIENVEKSENDIEKNNESLSNDSQEKEPFVDNTVFGMARKINEIEELGRNLDTKVNFNPGNVKASENIKNGYESVLSDDELRRNRRQLINFITRGEKAGKVDPQLYKQLEKLNKEIDKRNSERIHKNDDKHTNEGLTNNSQEKKPFVDNTVFGRARKIDEISELGKNLDTKVNFNPGNVKASENIRNGYESGLSDDELRRNRRQLINFITRGEKAGKVDPQLYKQLEKLNKEIDKRHSERINKNDAEKYNSEHISDMAGNNLIEDKSNGRNLIEDKHKNKSDIEDSNRPLIEDKHEKVPLIEDKHEKVPLIEDKHKKVPLIEDKHNKPIRTGLQILREEYNKMPEITRKHTASERTKPLTVALTLGTAAATVLSGGMLPLVLGLSAGSALIGLGLKPFLKKVTGQDKIERQIADQFRNLNDKDFKMLTDYLTEEKIVDLKLNAVVLHALNKVNIEKTLSEKNKLQEDKNRLTEENIKLTEEFENPNTSRERKAEIEKIMQKNSKEIDSIQGYTIQKTGEKVPGKVEIAERKLKDLKRGMERQTWNYRGNVGDKGFMGRFSNIFSHRNSSTKDYLPVLNEYADAEYEMLDKKENGNDIVASEKARKTMEDIEKDNSSRGFLGRHVGVFNSRNGVMRIMSDVMDDTFKIATTVGLATIGFAKTLSTMANDIKINDQNIRAGQDIKSQYDNVYSQMGTQYGAVSKGDISKANDAIATNYANRQEVIGFRMDGMYSNPNYRVNDVELNKVLEGYSSNHSINDSPISSMIEKLADNKKVGLTDQDALNQMADKLRGYKGVDHSVQADFVMNSNDQIQAETNLLHNFAGFAKIFENWKDMPAKFQQIKLDLLGPAIMAMSPILGIGHDTVRNKETAINLRNQEKNDGKDM